MKKANLFMWAYILLLVTMFLGTAYADEKSNNQLHGRVLGVIEAPIAVAKKISADRAKLTKQFPALEEFYKKQKLEILPNNYLGEITNPLEKLTVKIGNETTITNENGEFFFEDIPDLANSSTVEVEILFADKLIERKLATLLTEQRIEDIIIRRTLDDVFKNMKIITTDKIMAAASIPCLDNNGILAWNFVYSDCYNSLFLGPPWYKWMCWAEAMNQTHDHHGNIWCDGTHNCSLWVHGWDWSKQNDGHRHNSLWWPIW